LLSPKLWKTPRQSRCSAALRRKRSALTGGQRAFARIQREGASAPPAPTPRKYKNKNLAGDGGVGPAFASECRVVRDRTERPQDEHAAMPPAPVYLNCVYGHSATGPRVMNTAFHFVSGRVFCAAHVSCTCIFSRVNRCTCAAHVCATIPARGCRFSARVHVGCF
jgi:hypothetical protein